MGLSRNKYRIRDTSFSKRIILLVSLFLTGMVGYTQDLDFESLSPGGVRFYLDKDSSSYFRVFSFNHIWARYTRMNPGSVDGEGRALFSDFDIGIRRNRSGFYFHLFDRIIAMSQFGISAQTYTSQTRPQLFFLDLHTEYAFIRRELHLGYGLHSWNGVARQSNVGAPHFLLVDNPGFSYPLVGSFDQSGRQLGIYAKGLVGDLEYRASLSKPFSYEAFDDSLMNRSFEYPNPHYAWKAYVNWQFFDNENDVFPWKRMNYLGSKKLLNIGFGIHYHKDAMKYYQDESLIPLHTDLLLLAWDIFVEWPMQRNSSFTGYLVWYNYDFGPNYLKAGGLMNNGFGGEFKGEPLIQGGGNSEWSHGTGDIVHIELGYLLPGYPWLKNKKIQFFGGYTFKDLEALNCKLNQYDAGFNYFIFGNHVKLGMQASSRPIYVGMPGENGFGEIVEHRWTFIFNTQIDF